MKCPICESDKCVPLICESCGGLHCQVINDCYGGKVYTGHHSDDARKIRKEANIALKGYEKDTYRKLWYSLQEYLEEMSDDKNYDHIKRGVDHVLNEMWEYELSNRIPHGETAQKKHDECLKRMKEGKK